VEEQKMKSRYELSCIVGGQQGEGIESVGEILAKAMGRMGYCLFGSRNFSSRIKGGHTDFNLRISQEYVYTNSEEIDIIIAFDEDTIQLHQNSIVKNGVILSDPKTVNLKNITMRSDVHYIEIPFSQLAIEINGALLKNMISIGSTCLLLNKPLDEFEKAIQEQFSKKGEKIVEMNIKALHKGYEILRERTDIRFPLDSATSGQKIFLSGNEAISLGAVLGGCRFMAGYPITPASEVLENLTKIIPQYGGVVVQSEDELSAIGMVIGAGYTGVRAMTATAGPGLSLMQEAIGLSGAVEIPIVIVDCQRGGPSSGMATKFEQSDLNAMMFGTHGESPRIILSPSTVIEALLDMPKAFNLAEQYQCPVFVASDLLLATSKQTFDLMDIEQIDINRGNMISDEELLDNEKPFHDRFAVTQDGISARSIPGQKKGTHHVTGIEHGPTGHPSENPDNRISQMDKRSIKIKHVPQDQAIKFEGNKKPDILFVGFGSTYGAIREARRHLETQGRSIGHAHIRMVQPLPKEELLKYTDHAHTVIIVEQNSTGQLGNIIKQNIAIHDKLHSCLKYNGVPISVSDITSFVEQIGSIKKELV
jgi:2-oxoglutarate/2-oxoacid ferredoxin oxidoreductase subunit alpha